MEEEISPPPYETTQTPLPSSESSVAATSPLEDPGDVESEPEEEMASAAPPSGSTVPVGDTEDVIDLSEPGVDIVQNHQRHARPHEDHPSELGDYEEDLSTGSQEAELASPSPSLASSHDNLATDPSNALANEILDRFRNEDYLRDLAYHANVFDDYLRGERLSAEILNTSLSQVMELLQELHLAGGKDSSRELGDIMLTLMARNRLSEQRKLISEIELGGEGGVPPRRSFKDLGFE